MLDALGTVYVGLSSTPPTKAGGNITPPAGEYVRATVTFGAAASRKRSTTGISNFVSGGGLATTNQGTFGYATFYSALTGGTFLASTQLSAALAWTLGQAVTMAAGDVSLEFEAS
jgi:hypothetical protein